jgi:hypothetical protein
MGMRVMTEIVTKVYVTLQNYRLTLRTISKGTPEMMQITHQLLTFFSWESPDVCEVMTHEDVLKTMDKNLASSYVGLPNLMYVLFSHRDIFCVIVHQLIHLLQSCGVLWIRHSIHGC